MCRDRAIVSSSMMGQTRNYKSRVSNLGFHPI